MLNSSDECQSRSVLHEVVALSALHSIWISYQPLQVAESLADVLLNTLPLDFVCIRLRCTGNGDESEVIRTSPYYSVDDHAAGDRPSACGVVR